MKTETELRKKLNELFNEIRTRKLAWRFNYSVGLIDGSCFGSSRDDDRLLIKLNVPQEKKNNSEGSNSDYLERGNDNKNRKVKAKENERNRQIY